MQQNTPSFQRQNCKKCLRASKNRAWRGKVLSEIDERKLQILVASDRKYTSTMTNMLRTSRNRKKNMGKKQMYNNFFLHCFLGPFYSFFFKLKYSSCIVLYKLQVYNISSVSQFCLTLCDLMDCSMLGFLVHHQLLNLTQTQVHWVGDAIQPSHPL